MSRIANIMRREIHRSQGNVSIVDNKKMIIAYRDVSGELVQNSYQLNKGKLVVTNIKNRSTTLVEQVSKMVINKRLNGVDIEIEVTAGKIGRSIHVFSALE